VQGFDPEHFKKKRKTSGVKWWIRCFLHVTLNEKGQDKKGDTIFQERRNQKKKKKGDKTTKKPGEREKNVENSPQLPYWLCGGQWGMGRGV
jgi:hypothetical protein